jgi:hypothetical protein
VGKAEGAAMGKRVVAARTRDWLRLGRSPMALVAKVRLSERAVQVVGSENSPSCEETQHVGKS